MYLDCKVKIPSEGGKITVKTISGTSYVYYETGRQYDDFLEIKTELEADVYLLETIILNGKNEDVIIDEAIRRNRKIRVEPCRYNRQKELEKTGKELILDPYQLVTEKSRYYLICFVNDENSIYHGKGLENLRIDRFWSVELLDSKRRDVNQIPGYENGRNFQLDEYMKEHIYMWSGESKRVTLRIKTGNIGDFIDWFGTDFRVLKEDEEYMEVSIRVNENAIRYWALQYGGMATILEPPELRRSIRLAIDEMRQNYMD